MAISNNSTGLRPGVCTSSTRPTAPYEGQMIYETDTDLTYIWGGSAWQQVSGGTAVGNSGLVYITSATVGSGVTTATVSNCFSSAYHSYQIVMSDVGCSVNGNELRFSLNAAGAGNYRFGGYYVTYSSATVNGYNSNGADFWVVAFTTSSSAYNNSLIIDTIGPYSGLTPRFSCTWASGAYSGTFSGVAADTANNTGFTLFPSAGTFTGGTIRVYGYRK